MIRTVATGYSVPITTALDEATVALKQNQTLLHTPRADVDANLMLVQSRLAQLRQKANAEGVDLDQLTKTLAERAIEGTTITQDTAVSSLKALMPAEVASVNEPYSAQIARETPGYITLGLDLSDSVNFPWDPTKKRGEAPSKLRDIERVLNELLFQLAVKAGEEIEVAGEMEYIVKDYFHLSVMSYGDGKIRSLLPHELREGQTLWAKAPLSAVVANPVAMKDDKPIFFQNLHASGDTPMNTFFEGVERPMREWSEQHPNDFPPILINLTDGVWTDQTPVNAARKLQNIKGADGNALVFNCHIAGGTGTKPILFPQSKDQLPKGDLYAQALFDMSSELPPRFLEEAKRMGLVPADATSARAMAYNCDIEKLLDFLVIGTRAKDPSIK